MIILQMRYNNYHNKNRISNDNIEQLDVIWILFSNISHQILFIFMKFIWYRSSFKIEIFIKTFSVLYGRRILNKRLKDRFLARQNKLKSYGSGEHAEVSFAYMLLENDQSNEVRFELCLTSFNEIIVIKFMFCDFSWHQ